MTGLAGGVLAVMDTHVHVGPDERLDWRCTCGEMVPLTDGCLVPYPWHRAHVAAAVTAWLAERLASDEVREAVADAINHDDNYEMYLGEWGIHPELAADAALTAVLSALEVER